MPNIESLNKVIAVVGPTGSGKSALATDLALKFEGEIISADSRQVYKGLNISSGKTEPQEMRGVAHYLINIAALKEDFSLASYLRLARKKVAEILNRGKLPIVVGGTGLYITSLLEGYEVPEVPPNSELRKKLQKLPLGKLQDAYHALDPEGFKKIDTANPRRLIRAIEVVTATKLPFFNLQAKAKAFDYLMLGIEIPWEQLKDKIKRRLFDRYNKGMLQEIKDLLVQGVPEEKLRSLGLEQKWMLNIIAGAKEKEALDELLKEEIAYAKRQLTWWRKKPVVWVKDLKDAKKEVEKFLGV